MDGNGWAAMRRRLVRAGEPTARRRRTLLLAAVVALALAPGALAQEAPIEAPQDDEAVYEVAELTCGAGTEEMPEDAGEIDEPVAGDGEPVAGRCSSASIYDYAPAAGSGSVAAAVERSLASGERCGWAKAWRTKTNGMFVILWRYFLRISWCWNGARITSLSSRRWAEIYVPFWEFAGHVGWEAAGGVGSYRATRWTQGKFRLCSGISGCFVTKLPWVELRVNARGDYAADWGG